MAQYIIDGIPLSDFGITVSKFSGFESVKRKGKTEHSFPDENGVQAFTDAVDIIFEARDLEIRGNLVADTIEDAQSQFLAFQDLIYSSGEKEFYISYLGRKFIVYFKDNPLGKRIGDIGGKVYYDLAFKLREINPINTAFTSYALDFVDNNYTDFTGNLYYLID